MRDTGRGSGLRTIFSFFLGLMLTAFVGIGVYTFYPQPTEFRIQLRELAAREQEIRHSRPDSELTDADRDQIQEVTRQQNELTEAAAEQRESWALSTSIILIVFSTLSLVASLVRADRLQVISNGLLLGGVFTMLYSVGWIFTTGASITRFLVMTTALAITLGLGYVRFVRRSKTQLVTGGGEGSLVEGFADIDRRVRGLEKRMNEAAHALGQEHDDSSTS
jgi:hypothetical protein